MLTNVTELAVVKLFWFSLMTPHKQAIRRRKNSKTVEFYNRTNSRNSIFLPKGISRLKPTPDNFWEYLLGYEQENCAYQYDFLSHLKQKYNSFLTEIKIINTYTHQHCVIIMLTQSDAVTQELEIHFLTFDLHNNLLTQYLKSTRNLLAYYTY